MENRGTIDVAFRVDAGAQFGSGHVMRTLTLADAIKKDGARVRFVSRHMPAYFQRILVNRGHEFVALDEPEVVGSVDNLAHSHWLGTTQSCDASQTDRALSDRFWDWLVVDHYALDCRWETPLRARARKIMVIDDLADRIHDCDVLLDQNLMADYLVRYDRKVPVGSYKLLGPQYALLQPIYAAMHHRAVARQKPISRIFIFFGAGDRKNVTGRSIAALLQLKLSGIVVDVVVGVDSPHLDSIRRQVSGHPEIKLHGGIATLAPLMLAADLAIGACGATTWERLCLGLPALIITLADNQRSVASYLHSEGMVHWIGDDGRADQRAITSALDHILQSAELTEWSRRCLQSCDGLGSLHVLRVMTGLSGGGNAGSSVVDPPPVNIRD